MSVVMASVRVGEVAQADAHVVIDRSGNGDGNRDPQDGVRNAKRIEIAIANKKEARGYAPDQSDRREDGIGQMRQSEDACRRKRRLRRPREDFQEAQEKEALQQELLNQGPDGVSEVGANECRHTRGNAKRALCCRD